jgi:O-antigen biosynthesis protein
VNVVTSTLRRTNSLPVRLARKLWRSKRHRIEAAAADPAALRIAEDRRTIQGSNLFDAAWYLAEYADVARAGVDPLDHFVSAGAFEGRNPGPNFNTKKHLRRYPLLKDSGVNPLVHYVRIQNGTAPLGTPLYEARADFKTYAEFLTSSVFSPILQFPYSASEAYVLSYMDSRRSYLRERYAARSQNKLVSVVMATYNRAHCIAQAIGSLRAQSYENWELIVVDDCGTDDTRSVVAALDDPRIRFVRLHQNRGPAGARNAGLENARGDYVCYLDSDNAMHEDFILILANELSLNPDFDVVYCAQRALKIWPDRIAEMYVRFGAFHRPAIENRNYIDLGAIMHRRSMINRYGGFNGSLRRLVDWDLILRYTVDKPARGVPCILSNYHFADPNNQVTAVVPIEENMAKVDASLGPDRVSTHLPGVRLPGIEQMFSPPPRRFTGRVQPVSIVIPSFEAESYLRACIESIFAFSSGTPFEIIIVDNASSPSVVAFLRELERSGRARIILNERNLGFTHAVNQGIELAAPESDILILNNDAIATQGWLAALQQVLYDYPEVGLIVPQQVVLPGEKTAPVHQPGANFLRECDINLSEHHANVVDVFFDGLNGYVELSFAPFFCVYIPRDTLRMVGLLDVENGPHYRSDRLYCDLVRDITGRRILYTPHSKVYHFVQRATSQLKTDHKELYQKMFVQNDWREISGHRAAAP